MEFFKKLNRKVKIKEVKLESITIKYWFSNGKKHNPNKMFLKVLYLLVFFTYLINLRVYAFLRNDLTDNYIQEYLDKIYLEKDLVNFDDDFNSKENYHTSIESNLADNIFKVHKNQILNNLGGSERLIELMKLLENNAKKEEEESIDEGIELKDYFDKIVLSSNLDSNYYHYFNEIEGGELENFDGFGTNRLKISFAQVFKNKFLSRINKGIKEYEFKSMVDPIDEMEYKLREFDYNETSRYKKENFIVYSDGYYLVKRKNFSEGKVDEYNYSIKIESPMEIVDFNELVILDEIKLLHKKKINFKLNNGIQNTFKGDSNYNKRNKKDQNNFKEFYNENYGEEEEEENYYEELEEDYNSKEDYQRIRVAKNILTKAYPVCELKCVIRDLQNKVQWTEKIMKFTDKDKILDMEKFDVNIISSNNWCDRLIFHNCVGFELESMKISIMNEKLLEKVDFIENVLDSQMNSQIEKYFNHLFQDLTSKTLKPRQIGKIILLNEILESNGFIISRNGKNKNELLMRYEKISKFSWNLISLSQIIGNVKYKLKINHYNKGFTVLNSSSGFLTKKNDLLINVIKPIIKQKYVLDIEQVLIFIQNILFILKNEKANKNIIFLPWYNKLTKDAFTKQNNFINSLFSEYFTLVRLFNKQKFYSKERFYRLNTLNIYSLISHYKSYESGNHKNKFGRVIHPSEIQVFVINTTLTYYEQKKINSIFVEKSIYLMNNLDIHVNINDIKFKYLKEYFIPSKYVIEQDEWYEQGEIDEDFDLYEDYFKNKESEKMSGSDYMIETPKLIKKSMGIKGNIEFNPNDLIFQINLNNFGFNIAFINYIYQNSLNLDDSVITNPPWWMVWQSQFYPRLSLEKNTKEQDLSLMENPDEFSKEINSTWLELPINSENPSSFIDLGSFIPKEIISKEILESVILEEVELINPTGVKKGDLNYGKNKDNNIWEIIKEKQQFYISKWKKFDVINDPSNLFFYNLFNKRQTFSTSSNFNSTKFHFNPCIINIFSENNNSEWLANCNAKWKIYSFLFEQYTSTINHYLNISTFFDLLNEIKILLLIQNQIK